MAHALIVDDDPDVVDWLQEVARMEGLYRGAGAQPCAKRASSSAGSARTCC